MKGIINGEVLYHVDSTYHILLILFKDGFVFFYSIMLSQAIKNVMH